MKHLKKNLKSLVLKLNPFLNFIGIDPLIGYYNLKGLLFFRKDLKKMKVQKGNDELFPFAKHIPILTERYASGGVMSGHYFHQDLHVAKLIFKNNPKKHVDIGSRTDGFVAHVASFREIELIDIRPIRNTISNISFKQADLMNLSKYDENYCDSISSLHAIEHFGLGRYNDPIDYLGHEKGIDNIAKMLTNSGIFYFSVPIGLQRINFNAHRVFSISYLLKFLSKNFSLKSFSFVDDSGIFHPNISLDCQLIESNCGCYYGCGIFELIKNNTITSTGF